MPGAPRIPAALTDQIQRLRSRWKAVAMAGGVGTTLWLTATLFALALVIDLLIDLPVWARVGLSLSVLFGGLVTAAVKVLGPAWRRIEDQKLAAYVESVHPELDERLISALELAEESAVEKASSSPVMRRWLLAETVQFSRQHDFADTVNATPAIRRCWAGAIALCSLLLPLIFAGTSYGVLISRFLNPFGNYERIQNLMLDVVEGDRLVPRGEDVTLITQIHWRLYEGTIPPTAWLEWTADQGPVQRRRLDWDDQQQAYVGTLSRVESSLTYDVAAGGARTRRYRLDVADRPQLSRLSAEIDPPAYSGEAAVQLPTVLGEIRCLEQSRLALRAEFSLPVVSAELLWLDGPAAAGMTDTLSNGLPVTARVPLPLSADGKSATWETIVSLRERSGRFLVRGTDARGFTTGEEAIRRLTVSPDLPPVIGIAGARETLEARPNDILHFDVVAGDDFGLTDVELHYELILGASRDRGLLKVPEQQLPQRSLAHSFTLDLTQFNPPLGSVMTIKARAVDNRPVPHPNETWTQPTQITFRRNARPLEDHALTEEQQRLAQVLDALRAELDKLQEQARQLQNDAKTDIARQREWKRDEETSRLQQRLDDLQEQYKKLDEVFSQQPLTEPLAEQVQQMLEEQIAQARQAIEKAQQSSLRDKPQPFGEAAEALEAASKKTGEMQSQFQEIASLQRDLLELGRLADQTSRLADRVEDLVQRAPKERHVEEARRANLDNPEEQAGRWQRDHRQSQQLHQQLERQLAELASQRPELKGSAISALQQQLTRVADQTQQLADQQRELQGTKEAEQPTPPATSPAREEGEAPPAPTDDERSSKEKEAVTAAAERARQQEQQEELQRQLSATRQELQAATQDLQLPIINSPDHAESAEKANQLAGEAEAAMEGARQQSQAGNASGSQQQRQLAAEKLQQAATATRRASELPLPAENPHLPPEVSEQIASAARQLRRAGEQLAQLGPASDAQGTQESREGNQSPRPPQTFSNKKKSSSGDPAKTLREAAQSFASAAECAGGKGGGNSSKGSPRSSASAQGQGGQRGNAGQESQKSGSSPGGGPRGEQASDLLSQLEANLGQVSNRNWGRLPGKLGTELLESAQRRPTGEYAQPIRRYFERISTPQPAEIPRD
ncbi:DUF4175 family protein [Planctomicrobium sp. SH664]|uniref:DUF4175 family protein n=1 Tax=Planctomicrobium sp. SH664 TaxID=3448125 RepID=UPI003F5CB495